MIPAFGHHLVSLLPATGSQGAVGSKTSAAAVKDAIRTAERINGALKSACRIEAALVPPHDDLFSAASGQAKHRRAAWTAIRNATNLRWMLPTAHPELIHSALPDDWIGKGYRNVCFGAIIDHPDRFGEARRHLAMLPCHLRMMLFGSLPQEIDLLDGLDGIDWIVAGGDADEHDQAEAIRTKCQSAGIAFLFLPRNLAPSDPAAEVGSSNADPVTPISDHPFGPDLHLRRPTLPALRKAEAATLTWNMTPSPPTPPPVVAETLPPDPIASSETSTDTESDPSDNPPWDPVVETSPEIRLEPLPHEPDNASGELSASDHNDFARLDDTVRRGVAAFMECGLALAEIHDRKLWHAGGHATWESYVRSVLGMSKPHAHRLVQAAKIATEISAALPNGNADVPAVRPASESQVRPLCRLKDAEKRTTAWSLAVQRADGQPTAKMISDVVAELMAEHPPVTASRPTPKERLREAINKLRASILEGQPVAQLTGLLDELEAQLKLA